MSDKLEKAIISLIKDKEFYSAMLMNMHKIKDSKCPTMGVAIKQNVMLYYNEDFVNNLSIKDLVGILRHECSHIINNHIIRGRKIGVDNMLEHQTFNLAADTAINDVLVDVPREIKVKGKKSKTWNSDMLNEILKSRGSKLVARPNDVAEYYYNLIKEEGRSNPKPGDVSMGGECVDDHSQWENSDSSVEAQEQVLKDFMKKSVNTAKDNQCGDVPGEALKLIDELSRSRVNWRSLLRRFINNAQETVIEETRKRRNRRYGMSYPGFRKEDKLNIAIAVDNSGSCWDKQQLFFSEVDSIYKTGNISITVFTCDTKVNQEFEYKPKIKIESKGGGGTLYSPMFVKANDLGCDGLIILGDMDNFDKENVKRPKYPVLWASVGSDQRPFEFGSLIRIDEK